MIKTQSPLNTQAMQKAVAEAQAIKRTPFGQQILDTICDRVADKSGYGHFGWSIGKTETVVKYVARTLGKSVHSVAGGLSHLIDTGLIHNNIVTDDEFEIEKDDELGLLRATWFCYSKWDIERLREHRHGPTEDDDEDYWLEWDGVDGTTIPYNVPMAFDDEDEELITNIGDKLLFTVEKPDHDDWYLVYTPDAAQYYEDMDEFDPWPEILLVSGDAYGWTIDCSFDADTKKNKTTLDYLTRPDHFVKYDKWELMRMFNYDGKYSGLADHISQTFRELKGK